jgi:hypothetical protein
MKTENIKFKAKRLDNGEWIIGSFVVMKIPALSKTTIGIVAAGGATLHEIDPSTVCQFTGEKDMRGKEIYIGDIISNLETGSVVEVVWNDKMKMLDCKFLNGVKCCFDIPFGTFVARYHRIVVLMSKFDKEK